MKILLLIALIAFNSYAHEGDEEVTAKFAPRFGGRVSAVVGEEDHKVKSAHHDEPKYMAEIIISDANIVRVYFYDLEMKMLDLSNFPAEIKGSTKTKGQSSKGEVIVLTKQTKNFTGKLPLIKKKPYDVTFEFTAKNEPLHINFKAMD